MDVVQEDAEPISQVRPVAPPAHGQGSEAAFIALVAAEQSGLVAAVSMIVGNAATAEEVVQEVLGRTYQRWAKVSAMDRPGAWVRRAVINQAISVARRAGSERRAMRRMRAVRIDPIAAPELPSPEIWAAVRTLSENQMRAVVSASQALVEVRRWART